MHKISLSHNQTPGRLRVILLLSALIGLTPIQTVKADVAPPPDPKLGGVVPYQPLKTNVQMISETVLIDILPPPPIDAQTPKRAKVNASFTMRNQGQAEEQMQVIFPLSNLENPYADPSDYYLDSSSFTARVDGKLASITKISTPAEVAAFMDQENNAAGYFQIQWAAFEVTFPVQQDVLLEVQYDMLFNEQANPYQVMGFDGIHYVLETGAGWYGNILSADIILRFPYPASEEVVSNANPGYVFSGNEMRWQFRDFEPTQEDNLAVRLFPVEAWQIILNLRARVKQNPKDMDAWAELGNRYFDYAVTGKDGTIFVISPFMELAVEARQHVVDLYPDSGDAHYQLAESLWFNIPGVQNRQRAIASDVHLDDPAVQQVFRELEQAWAHGTEVTEYDSFFYDMESTFPGLILKPPAITTVTTAPLTPTLAPTTVVITPATASPVVILTGTPTPIPPAMPSMAPYGTTILVLGVMLALALFAYRWKIKPRARN